MKKILLILALIFCSQSLLAESSVRSFHLYSDKELDYYARIQQIGDLFYISQCSVTSGQCQEIHQKALTASELYSLVPKESLGKQGSDSLINWEDAASFSATALLTPILTGASLWGISYLYFLWMGESRLLSKTNTVTSSFFADPLGWVSGNFETFICGLGCKCGRCDCHRCPCMKAEKTSKVYKFGAPLLSMIFGLMGSMEIVESATDYMKGPEAAVLVESSNIMTVQVPSVQTFIAEVLKLTKGK